MNPDYDKQLEAAISRELKALPELAAPAALASRVMAAIEQRARVPWYRRSWQTWPVALRRCFVRCAAGAVCGSLFWRLAVGTLATLTPARTGGLRLVQFGECGLERRKRSGKCAGAGVSESWTGSRHRHALSCGDLLCHVCWFGNSLLAARLFASLKERQIMKKILRNILIVDGAATLGLLALLARR